MDVIVLAGGLGTRLRNVINDRPKPMALINGKPFLYYIFCWLEKQNIERIILSVGYKSEIIKDYFGDKLKNMKILYVMEDKPLGTGGAILQSLCKSNKSPVFVVNGDTFFPISLKNLEKFHRENNALISLALKRIKKQSRYGTVVLNNKNKIMKFEEKKYVNSGLINGGIYLINKEFFIEKYGVKKVFSIERDVFEKDTIDNQLYGKVCSEKFVDIGLPQDYFKIMHDKVFFSKYE